MADTPSRKFNLSLEEAMKEMEGQLANMREHPRGELEGMDPDTAFEKGYEIALFDLRHYTGPDPRTTPKKEHHQ